MYCNLELLHIGRLEAIVGQKIEALEEATKCQGLSLIHIVHTANT